MLFQRLLPIWTPVVLTAVSTVEFFVTYGQLETHLPALNGAALAITRALTYSPLCSMTPLPHDLVHDLSELTAGMEQVVGRPLAHPTAHAHQPQPLRRHCRDRPPHAAQRLRPGCHR